MTATVHIVTDKRDGVLRVPDQALRYAPGGVAGTAGTPGAEGPVSGDGGEDAEASVWVLRNGQPVRIPVTIGLDDDTSAEVVRGDLHEGDQVIVSEEVRGSGAPAQGRGGTPRMRF
jgi:HlyD family secretion protein